MPIALSNGCVGEWKEAQPFSLTDEGEGCIIPI